MSTHSTVPYEALSEVQRFRILRDEYLERLQSVIPRVTSEQLEAAIRVFNTLRPHSWAVSDSPGNIVGRTKDGQIVYAGEGELPPLYMAESDKLRARIARRINKLRGTPEGQLGLQVQDIESPELEHLKGLETILDELQQQGQ